jgi:hypothetical protein
MSDRTRLFNSVRKETLDKNQNKKNAKREIKAIESTGECDIQRIKMKSEFLIRFLDWEKERKFKGIMSCLKKQKYKRRIE